MTPTVLFIASLHCRRERSRDFGTRIRCGPDDPQIAHVAYTAGNLDMMRARRKLQKALAPEVRNALTGTFPFAGRECAALTAKVIARFLATRRVAFKRSS